MAFSTDDLACSFDDARANQLRDGARLTTRDKIAFFEEMADFAFRFAPAPEPIAFKLQGSVNNPL